MCERFCNVGCDADRAWRLAAAGRVSQTVVDTLSPSSFTSSFALSLRPKPHHATSSSADWRLPLKAQACAARSCISTSPSPVLPIGRLRFIDGPKFSLQCLSCRCTDTEFGVYFIIDNIHIEKCTRGPRLGAKHSARRLAQKTVSVDSFFASPRRRRFRLAWSHYGPSLTKWFGTASRWLGHPIRTGQDS